MLFPSSRGLWLVLLLAPLLTVPATAQGLTVAPAALAVEVEADAPTVERAVTLTNGGSDALVVSVEVGVPGAADAPPPGTILGVSPEFTGDSGLATLPDGRVFSAESAGAGWTHELTADLARVRLLSHPASAFLAGTTGLAFDADAGPEGTLWWLDSRRDRTCQCVAVEEAQLLEGTLDGTPTGRSLPVTLGAGRYPPYRTGIPAGLAYDAASEGGTGLFYYLDVHNNAVYAVDRAGAVAEGYPVPKTEYADAYQGSGLALTRRAPAAGGGAWLDVTVGFSFVDFAPSLIVATDPVTGRHLGPETPIPSLLSEVQPDGSAGLVYAVARSRRSPDDTLYVTAWTGFIGGGRVDTYALRPAYVPPWRVGLFVAEQEGDVADNPDTLDVAPGEAAELMVRFGAGDALPGTYAAELVVRLAETGEALASVPLSVTVTGTTAGEGGPTLPAAVLLEEPYPNPARSAATVTLALPAAAEVAVSVHDVLGRRVLALPTRPVEAGRHGLRLSTSALAAGTYLVRAEVRTGAETRVLTRRLTVVR